MDKVSKVRMDQQDRHNKHVMLIMPTMVRPQLTHVITVTLHTFIPFILLHVLDVMFISPLELVKVIIERVIVFI